eukprot:TRINITY_DN1873_c0_g1_i1.p1 TRINITY_DN1873_c0_g1~~TRINITY_DN1873_c0_g1_i1.p1  ORF type:complete len:467 (-),score=120.12 TRINITY_DN1873_c0_g1_i1:290-1690(-)
MAFVQISNREVESLESGLSGEDSPSPQVQNRFSSKRLFAIGAGLLGLAGCACAVVSTGPQPTLQPVGVISARQLLEHPEFIDAASNNVWQLGKQHMAGKEHKLKPAVHRMMSKLSEIIAEYDPEGAQHLDKIQLSPAQRSDAIAVVKRMGDRRVQAVGKEVLQIALKHKDDGEKSMQKIADEFRATFSPRKQELSALRESVLPASVREREEAADTDVEEAAARRLGTTKHCTGDATQCNPGGAITSAMGTDMSMKMEDALALIGGLAEQARLALDEANTIGTSFGSVNHHVPWYFRSLVGGLAFGTETLDCVMRQDDVHTTKKDGTTVLKSSVGGESNSVKLAMCPMKYAGAGMDALSGINNIMGVQNSRLPQDFQMMFGGGAAPQAGYNPLGAPQPRAAASPFSMFAPQQPAAHPATQAAHGFLNNMGLNRGAAQPAYHPAMQQPAYGMQAYHPAVQHPGFAYPR